jgi:hypothetical protein
VLLRIPEQADTAAMQTLASDATGMEVSVFAADDVGWQSPNPRQTVWTHVWEQGFPDMVALRQYLDSPAGAQCSDLNGLRRTGVDVESMMILTYPFKLKPAQSPPEPTLETSSVLLSITARLGEANVSAYMDLLLDAYDRAVADAGMTLVHRWRTIGHASDVVEVQSVWEMPSVAAYDEIRKQLLVDERWVRFNDVAMPLVTGGERRLLRAL